MYLSEHLHTLLSRSENRAWILGHEILSTRIISDKEDTYCHLYIQEKVGVYTVGPR